MSNAIIGLLAILAAVLLIVWWPLGVIWSLNTLFGLHIPMDFRAWMAVIILVSVLRVSFTPSSKKP